MLRNRSANICEGGQNQRLKAFAVENFHLRGSVAQIVELRALYLRKVHGEKIGRYEVYVPLAKERRHLQRIRLSRRRMARASRASWPLKCSQTCHPGLPAIIASI